MEFDVPAAENNIPAENCVPAERVVPNENGVPAEGIAPAGNVFPAEGIIPAAARPDLPIRYELIVVALKVLITVMFFFPLAHYTLKGSDKVEETPAVPAVNRSETINMTVTLQEAVVTPNKTKTVRMRIVLPPTCAVPHIQTSLDELCEDYILKAACCTPEDFENEEKHKIPKNSTKGRQPSDPRANIVGFMTAGFLVVSLVATFLDVYKAKKQAPTKSKAPLTRKCSLADLTIMKHQRKEINRRDSILESQDEGRQPANNKKAPPLQRSSSTPAEPISEFLPYNFSRSFDSRRGSVMDSSGESSTSRRGSILDKFADRFDSSGRRISIDITSSPERKHHTRLVHRH